MKRAEHVEFSTGAGASWTADQDAVDAVIREHVAPHRRPNAVVVGRVGSTGRKYWDADSLEIDSRRLSGSADNAGIGAVGNRVERDRRPGFGHVNRTVRLRHGAHVDRPPP